MSNELEKVVHKFSPLQVIGGIIIATITTTVSVCGVGYAFVYGVKGDIKDIKTEQVQIKNEQTQSKQSIEKLSSKIDTLSEHVASTESDVFITREVIKIDPAMSEKLDYLTKIVTQNNDYIKKNSLIVWN